MKFQKEKLFRLLFYVLFGLVTFVFFMVLTFPFDLMEKKMIRQIEANTPCLLTLKDSRYGFPVKVFWNGIRTTCPKHILGLEGAGSVDLNIQSLTASLSPLPLLFQQEARIRFVIESSIGTLPGMLTLHEKDHQPHFALTLTEARLTIKETGLSGTFLIKGESEWVNQDILEGTGKLIFTIEEGRLSEFAGKALPIGEVTFSSINGQLFWKEGRAVIETLSAQGDLADLESDSGILLFRTPPENSLLTLSLRAIPKGSLKEMAGLFIQGYNGREPLRIRMNGPLSAPQLSMNGKAVRLGF